jgi:large subunit ribosomal protein L1
MAKESKRIRKAKQHVEADKIYILKEACETVVKTASTKFDETVDLAVNLGVDPRKADQNVRGSVALPHGLGKNIKVAVIAKGDKAEDAKAAGADFVGAEDLVTQIQGGFTDFDSLVATPDMMVQVGKIGKILGPRGLMPSPKTGTVTFDVKEIVKSLKAGRAEYRVDKTGIIHVPVGKASFGAEKIFDNASAMMQAIMKAKPSTSKGVYLKTSTLSLSMGPAVPVDLAPFRAL